MQYAPRQCDRPLPRTRMEVCQPAKRDPTLFLTEAKSRLGWYYVVCTDHSDAWFNEDDFKGFVIVAASLTSVDMAINDPANENIYKARAANTRNGRRLCTGFDSTKRSSGRNAERGGWV
jgi:hypothetical protein